MNEKLNCIMVIDDDEPTNFISTMLIEEANCTRHLQIVESGKKAMDYLENVKSCGNEKNCFIQPDLIFLDINMPRMNGWEFLDEYKKLKNSRLAKMVIIMLTTSLNPDDELKADNIPEVAGFEKKPLTTEMIHRVIKTYFDPNSLRVNKHAAKK
ncbi:MAG: response regulator [Ferruginibacter sp.]